MSNEKFLVQVVDTTFVPDLDSVREITKQLGAKLKANPALKAKFATDPRSVLNDLGVSLDLQREIIKDSGIGGLEEALDPTCYVSCIVTGCVITIFL